MEHISLQISVGGLVHAVREPEEVGGPPQVQHEADGGRSQGIAEHNRPEAHQIVPVLEVVYVEGGSGVYLRGVGSRINPGIEDDGVSKESEVVVVEAHAEVSNLRNLRVSVSFERDLMGGP